MTSRQKRLGYEKKRPMMSPIDKFLTYCTVSLVLKGTKLITGNPMLTFLQVFLLFSCISCYIYSGICKFINKNIQDLKGEEIMRIIANVNLSLFGIFLVLWFFWKEKMIVNFTRRTFTLLPKDSQTSIAKTSLVMMVLDVGYMLFTLALIQWDTDLVRISFSFTGYTLRIITGISLTYIVSSCCIYTSFLYMVHTFVCYRCKLIKKYLKKGKKPDLILINNSLHLILESLKEFESNFSFLPVSWFSNTFFFTSVNILVISASDTLASKTVFTIFFAIENFATFAVVILLFRLRKKWEKQCDMLCQNLVTEDQPSHESFVRLSIIKILDSIGSFRMTAMSIFYLDLPVILSLVGTVLTFTVLFIQLTH